MTKKSNVVLVRYKNRKRKVSSNRDAVVVSWEIEVEEGSQRPG